MSPHFSKIYIVVLQYNNSHDTVKCLESVAQLDYPDFEVVVVDNNSRKEEQDRIREFLKSFPILNAKYLLLNTNTGYAGGNNLGIRHALEHGADYVLILNPDTEVEKNLLTKLVSKAESDKKTGIVGPVVDESFDKAQDKGHKKIFGGRVQWLKPELQHISKPGSAGFLTGACILVKREVFEVVGFFDERYFLYFEDADFCMRVKELGYKLVVAEDATIHHAVSASTNKLGSPRLLRYHYRNAHLFNLKNGPWWAVLSLPFWSIFIIIRQLMKLVLLPSKRIVSLSIVRGVFDFYFWKFGKLR